MSANLESSTVATEQEKVSFHSNPKEGECQKNVPTTIQLCSFHILVSLYSKSFKLCFSSMWTENFQRYKLGLEKAENQAMATHSSTLAWRIPWMEGPGRLQSMGSLRVRHDWATLLSCIGEGNGNPLQCSCLENPRDGGAWWLPSTGSRRVGHDWSNWAAAAAGEEPEIKSPTSIGPQRKQGNSRKTSASASLTTLKPLCGSQQTVENS